MFKCHSLFVLPSSFQFEGSALGHIRSLLKGGHTQDLNTRRRKSPSSPLPKSPCTLCCSTEASFWAKEHTMAFNLRHPSSEAELILSWILNKYTIYNCFHKQWESLLKPSENATICTLLHGSINCAGSQIPRAKAE